MAGRLVSKWSAAPGFKVKTLGFCAKSTFGRGFGSRPWVWVSKTWVETSRNFTTTWMPKVWQNSNQKKEKQHTQATCNILRAWMQIEDVQQPAMERRGCISCNDEGTLGRWDVPRYICCTDTAGMSLCSWRSQGTFEDENSEKASQPWRSRSCSRRKRGTVSTSLTPQCAWI